MLTSSSTTGNSWSTGDTTQSITVSSAGTYTVSEVVNGCSSSAAGTIVTVNPGPAVSFGSVSEMCINYPPLTLTQGSPAGGTYSGLGVSGNQFDPSVAGVGNITLTYTYSDGSGCSGTAQIVVVVNGCAGIDEKEISKVSIYPNPSEGVFTVDAGKSMIESILIYDKSGKLVRDIKGSNKTNIAVNFTNMADGVYNLKITTTNSSESIPIILAR